MIRFAASKSTMFLNYLKDYTTKKIVRSQLSNDNLSPSGAKIESVGLLVDENDFEDREALLEILTSHGLRRDKIKILAYREKIKKTEVFDYPVFTPADISWRGTIQSAEVRQFASSPVDLLINYYDRERASLMLVSQHAQAGFKAGFSSVDKRLNHFMIDTSSQNYKIFTQELFKYLKILNKIA
jgi:hypothetical protein